MRKQAFILILAALLLVLSGATAAEMSKGKKKQAGMANPGDGKGKSAKKFDDTLQTVY